MIADSYVTSIPVSAETAKWLTSDDEKNHL